MKPTLAYDVFVANVAVVSGERASSLMTLNATTALFSCRLLGGTTVCLDLGIDGAAANAVALLDQQRIGLRIDCGGVDWKWSLILLSMKLWASLMEGSGYPTDTQRVQWVIGGR